jgi:hypothetical protein
LKQKLTVLNKGSNTGLRLFKIQTQPFASKFIMSQHEDQENNVRDEIFHSIVQLNKERLAVESQQHFFEAGKIKDQLKRLGQEYVKVALFSLRERQRQEREGLESEYEKELEELAKVWDERLAKNEEDIREFLQETQNRQAEEMIRFENDLKQNIPQQGRMSSEVLNLEFQIEKMVKDQRYTEAGHLQRRLETLKNDCLQKINQKTEDKVRNLLENYNKRHENELTVIEKRLNSERDELLKMREKDFERVHSKFKVFREKLESNHTADFIREQKKLKTFNPSSNQFAHLD